MNDIQRNNLNTAENMKSKMFCLLLFLTLVLGSTAAQNSEKRHENIHIVPQPLELIKGKGSFELDRNTKFFVKSKELLGLIDFFKMKINTATGYDLSVQNIKPKQGFISVEIDSTMSSNEEAYQLSVNANKIEIKGHSLSGVFYGMQTLLQLLPAEIESSAKISGTKWIIPSVEIRDEPRFKYRGMHLDVCRHFVSVENIKKHLDMMAIFKMNKFHWHLTEDQGWRIEIKAYPLLTSVGSKRIEGEGYEYGGYYTQDEIKEIVSYAAERMIDVIPEIELPGHALAALAAYPEFSCTGGPFKVRNIWGVEPNVFCAGKEGTFKFLENIIRELVPLFPSEYFHIGGDECPKSRWKDCPACQKVMKDEGLKNENELQSYFVKRVEKILIAHGKKMIGWDEILEGGLAPSATVMSWRGEEGGIEAATQGHDVVMTPSDWCYLDHYQGDNRIERQFIRVHALEKLLPIIVV